MCEQPHATLLFMPSTELVAVLFRLVEGSSLNKATLARCSHTPAEIERQVHVVAAQLLEVRPL